MIYVKLALLAPLVVLAAACWLLAWPLNKVSGLVFERLMPGGRT